MLLVLVVGCATPATEKELTYKLVSLGPMSVSIPMNLDKSQPEYDDATPEAIALDYYASTSGEVRLLLAEVDMKETQEVLNGPWEGWEALEDSGVTKSTVAEYLTLNYILRDGLGVFAPSRPVNRQLVVDGKEARELWYGSELGDERVRYHFLVVFSDEYVWVVLYSVEEDIWEKYDGSWDMIRDSVKVDLAN